MSRESQSPALLSVVAFSPLSLSQAFMAVIVAFEGERREAAWMVQDQVHPHIEFN